MLTNLAFLLSFVVSPMAQANPAPDLITTVFGTVYNNPYYGALSTSGTICEAQVEPMTVNNQSFLELLYDFGSGTANQNFFFDYPPSDIWSIDNSSHRISATSPDYSDSLEIQFDPQSLQMLSLRMKSQTEWCVLKGPEQR